MVFNDLFLLFAFELHRKCLEVVRSRIAIKLHPRMVFLLIIIIININKIDTTSITENTVAVLVITLH